MQQSGIQSGPCTRSGTNAQSPSPQSLELRHAGDDGLPPAEFLQRHRVPPGQLPEVALDADSNDALHSHETAEHQGNDDCDFPFLLSPVAPSQISLLEISPLEWYDLIARDAINNTQKLNDLFNADPTWTFDEASLSRRQSPIPELGPKDEESIQPDLVSNSNVSQDPSLSQNGGTEASKPWNTANNIDLSSEELLLMRYYVDVVGPILDLFDPSNHFTNAVPHLSMRNVGLLKSVLAVAAHHTSLGVGQRAGASTDDPYIQPVAPVPEAFGVQGINPRHLATQYYYETLQYLSQTLLHPKYAESPEILVTAMMISTYEMFEADVGESSKTGNWERHLRGSFWIQRNQDNNAESMDGLRRATWWAWIRQDIWAAFQAGRPTLTIFRPQRTIHEMNSDDLASWAVFLAAKCVEFAAQGRAPIDHQDLRQRIDRGNHLLKCLQEWYEILPASFLPMKSSSGIASSSLKGLSGFTPESSTSYSALPASGEFCTFPPVWVHPPNHAAGLQMYHFARSLVLLSQPSTGDLAEFRRRQKQLNDSLHMICGISNACRDSDAAMALINCQALYASKCSFWMFSSKGGFSAC